MRDKKLQVFVSSTYKDLIEERQAAVEAILSSGHIPAGMELFSAGDESQMVVIERWIDESDVYLLILGGRYGSIDKKTGKSYIQLEYNYAVKQKKSLFAIVISEKALEEKVKNIGSSAIEQDNAKELKMFRKEVLNNLVRFWDDKKDIKIAIHETISEFNNRKELIGWIRGDNLINTGLLAEQIASLTSENSQLRNRLNSDSGKHPVYATLTFNELETYLKKIIVKGKTKELNLFEYIMSFGKELSSGIEETGITNEIIEHLLTLKFIFKSPTREGYRGWKFTEDGHNFYLKALVAKKD